MSDTPRTYRHRAAPSQPRRPSRLVLALLLAGAVLVAAGVVVAVRLASGPAEDSTAAAEAGSCTSAPALLVAATPELAPVVSDVATQVTDDQDCPAVEVTPAESAAVEAAVASAAGSEAGSGGELPDVWLPDSSLWLTATEGTRDEAAAATSVASSPLVFAVGEETARALSEDSRPEVADLVRAAVGGTALTLKVSSEKQAPERVGAVASLYDAVQGTADARAAMTGLLRSVELTGGTPSEQLAGLPDQEGTAVAVSEQAMVTANSEDGLGLVGIYPHTVALDYPYAVLTDAPDATAVADELLERLRSPEGQAALQEAGFRDANGAAGVDAVEQAGVDSTTVTPAPMQPANLAMAEQAMALVQRESRLLAVLDVSGSMGWGLGGRNAPGPSRIAIARGAAADGLALYPDTTKLGLWTFPRVADTPRTHRRVVPVALLSAEGRRQSLAAALSDLREVPRGGTPLYATTLAAVRKMRGSWDPSRVNAVVVLSDGKDTEGGVSLSSLVSTLRSYRDSDRPVPVVTIGFGPDRDGQSLAAIAEASGGAYYPAASAKDIRKVFLDALGQRTCRPNC